MAAYLNLRSGAEPLDFAGARSLIEICRLDLKSVRTSVICDEDGGAGGHDPGDPTTEERLCAIAERLERAAGALDRVLESKSAFGAAADDVLVREADHRIKNSLQTVIALLRHQAHRADSDTVRDALQSAATRVEAVAQVHATLYSATGCYGIVPELDLNQHLDRLCTALCTALGVDGDRRIVHVEVEELAVSPSTAALLGLAVAELVTNALRHAFSSDRRGTVRVIGARRRDGCYQLCVSDDGCGMPNGFDPRQRQSGLGLRVVSRLADQLRARLTVDGNAGARFTLTLPPDI